MDKCRGGPPRATGHSAELTSMKAVRRRIEQQRLERAAEQRRALARLLPLEVAGIVSIGSSDAAAGASVRPSPPLASSPAATKRPLRGQFRDTTSSSGKLPPSRAPRPDAGAGESFLRGAFNDALKRGRPATDLPPSVWQQRRELALRCGEIGSYDDARGCFLVHHLPSLPPPAFSGVSSARPPPRLREEVLFVLDALRRRWRGITDGFDGGPGAEGQAAVAMAARDIRNDKWPGATLPASHGDTALAVFPLLAVAINEAARMSHDVCSHLCAFLLAVKAQVIDVQEHTTARTARAEREIESLRERLAVATAQVETLTASLDAERSRSSALSRSVDMAHHELRLLRLQLPAQAGTSPSASSAITAAIGVGERSSARLDEAEGPAVTVAVASSERSQSDRERQHFVYTQPRVDTRRVQERQHHLRGRVAHPCECADASVDCADLFFPLSLPPFAAASDTCAASAASQQQRGWPGVPVMALIPDPTRLHRISPSVAVAGGAALARWPDSDRRLIASRDRGASASPLGELLGAATSRAASPLPPQPPAKESGGRVAAVAVRRRRTHSGNEPPGTQREGRPAATASGGARSARQTPDRTPLLGEPVKQLISCATQTGVGDARHPHEIAVTATPLPPAGAGGGSLCAPPPLPPEELMRIPIEWLHATQLELLLSLDMDALDAPAVAAHCLARLSEKFGSPALAAPYIARFTAGVATTAEWSVRSWLFCRFTGCARAVEGGAPAAAAAADAAPENHHQQQRQERQDRSQCDSDSDSDVITAAFSKSTLLLWAAATYTLLSLPALGKHGRALMERGQLQVPPQLAQQLLDVLFPAELFSASHWTSARQSLAAAVMEGRGMAELLRGAVPRLIAEQLSPAGAKETTAAQSAQDVATLTSDEPVEGGAAVAHHRGGPVSGEIHADVLLARIVVAFPRHVAPSLEEYYRDSSTTAIDTPWLKL